MAGKQSVTALSLVVGTLLIAGGFAGISIAGEFDYRYETDYQSTNATHFVDNTTVDSVENVTEFDSLNDSQQEAVRSVGNGSLTFEERADVSGLPEHVHRSNTFSRYEVVANLDGGESTTALSGGAIGVGLLAVLYSLRLMNRGDED